MSIDYVNNYLLLTRNITHMTDPNNVPIPWNFQSPRDQLICEDGFIISVQAGENNYCSPKNNNGPWKTVECMPITGFPDGLVFTEAWEKYSDGESGVYGYVPVSLVNREIHIRGGIRGINKR